MYKYPILKQWGRIEYKFKKADFQKYLESLGDGVYFLQARKAIRQRTSLQNRYYWGVVLAIPAEAWGWSAEEVHQAFKAKFLRIIGERGLPDRIGSTKDLSTDDFSKYIEKIRQWLYHECGITIPAPEDADIPDVIYR